MRVSSLILLVPFLSVALAKKHATGKLTYGTPESVSLLSQPFVDLKANVSAYLTAKNYGSASYNLVHPLYPGATVIIGHQNTIVSHFAVGKEVLYKDVNGTQLPVAQQLPAQKDTIYDMASLSKMFTTIAALQQLDTGKLSTDATVASYIPDFAVNGKGNITILMLMTHTSGFDADPTPSLWQGYDTVAARKQAVIQQKIINTPGTKYLYSDLNYMTLQIVLETITATPLDQLVHDKFTAPLGMWDTFYNRGNRPLKKEILARIAATEFQIAAEGAAPDRPQPVWGTVHDENAWSLDGVSGHAGVFSTAYDLAIFSQMILNNGTYNGAQILKPSTVDLIFHNFNTAFPGNDHGLGFELNQNYWAGAMKGPQCAGHTGFTGTTMAIDRPSNTFFIFLSNRVHPSRAWSNVNVVRQNVGLFVARALGRNV